MSDSATMDSIFNLMHSLKRNLSEQLEAEPTRLVPMQARVLMIIHKQKNCTANDIVQIMKRDKAQVTRLISSLIDQDLLHKVPSPDDKRSHFLEFTKKGRKAEMFVLEQVELIQKRITSGLSKQEVEQFEATVAKMTKNLILPRVLTS